MENHQHITRFKVFASLTPHGGVIAPGSTSHISSIHNLQFLMKLQVVEVDPSVIQTGWAFVRDPDQHHMTKVLEL